MDWQAYVFFANFLTFLGLFFMWVGDELFNRLLKLLFLVLVFVNVFVLLHKFGWIVQL